MISYHRKFKLMLTVTFYTYLAQNLLSLEKSLNRPTCTKETTAYFLFTNEINTYMRLSCRICPRNLHSLFFSRRLKDIQRIGFLWFSNYNIYFFAQWNIGGLNKNSSIKCSRVLARTGLNNRAQLWGLSFWE